MWLRTGSIKSGFPQPTGAAEVLWSEGIPTHAVQTWSVLAEAADRIDHWQLGDAGPEEGEEPFTDREWEAQFDDQSENWLSLVAQHDVDGMWALIEEKLVSGHRLRSEGFQRPLGRVVNKCEEAPQNP